MAIVEFAAKEQIGILTIGDAAAMQKELLQSYLGQKAGEYIYERANGRSSDVVHAESEKAKSYSNETTMSEDITAENYDEKADPVLRGLSEHVSARMERGQARGLTVSVSAKTDDFRRRSRQTTLEKPTRDADVIYATAQVLLRLFQGNWTFLALWWTVFHNQSAEGRKKCKEAG